MASTYTPIATTTLGSAASSYTFSSIPSTYTDLVLVMDFDSAGTILGGIKLQMNSDTGTNYSFTFLQGDGSAAGSGRASNATQMEVGYQQALGRTNNIVQIQNYANTTTYKTLISRHNNPSSGGIVMSYVNLWRSTAAINSIKVFSLSNSFATGSTFTLYGIQAA